MTVEYRRKNPQGIWHIYKGDMRYDLPWPEPHMACGTVLGGWDQEMTRSRPIDICQRCERWELAELRKGES